MRALALGTTLAACLASTGILAWGRDPEDRVQQIAASTVFASLHCPTLAVNQRVASAAIEANGYTMEEISKGLPKQVIMRTYLALKAEPEKACYAIYDTFGPEGKGVRGIVFRKAR